MLISQRRRAVGPILLPVPVSSVVCCQVVAGSATAEGGSGERRPEIERPCGGCPESGG